MLKWLLTQIVKFLEVLLRNILATILIALIGLPVLVSWVTGTLDVLLQTIKSPMPLWGAIALVLLCYLYTRLKTQPYHPPTIQEELREELGVYWNNQNKLRCLKCKWPLKCSSDRKDPSLFFCSNCNLKHSLRDKNGKHLTEAQAIEELKKLPTNQ
jgi:hypothetical protein